MNSVLKILNCLKDLLENTDQLENTKFILDFPCSFAPKPFTQSTVVLGINHLDIKVGQFSGYLGKLNSKEYFGNEGKVKVKINVYVPKKIGSRESLNIFYKIYKSLTSDNKNINILSFSAKGVKYESSVDAFLLECEALVHSLVLLDENY